MSNFLFSSIKDFKSEIKKIFEQKLFFVVACALAFAVGIVLGAVLDPTEFILRYYTKNAENYYSIVMYSSSSCFNIFLERILVNSGYFLIFFALGLVPFLFPLKILIISYRGYVLSLTFAVFSAHFGMTGILLACFLILPQNLLTTVTLSLCSALNQKRKVKGKGAMAEFLLFTFLLYLISIAGAVIEVIILGLLLRPMNFYF